MRIFGVTPRDLELVKAMHSGTYILPERVLDHLLVKNGQEIVSYGSIQPLVEATLVTNPESSKREKLQSITILLNALKATCQMNNIPAVHVYTENIPYAEWLQERFGFQKIKGQALVLGFEDGSV
jgi:hypothetical protein